MAIYALDGQAPDLPKSGNYFIADTAAVIGRVRLLENASVWFGAVLRGDNEWIEVGARFQRPGRQHLSYRRGLSVDDRNQLYDRP